MTLPLRAKFALIAAMLFLTWNVSGFRAKRAAAIEWTAASVAGEMKGSLSR